MLLRGAMVVAVASGDRLSNHYQNGPAANGSCCVTPRVMRRRKPGLVSSSGNMTSDASSRRASRSRQLRRMSDDRGPRLSPQMALKVPKRLSATTSGERLWR